MDRRLRLLQVDEADSTPIYMQLARKLTSAIESGQWLAGEALPSERTLVDTLGISRVTTRKALQLLEEQGAILRSRGAGTFIAPRFEQPLPRLESFSEMVRPKGFRPNSELVGFVRRAPTGEEMNTLKLGAHDDVVELTRIRKADDIAISLQRAILAADVLPSPALLGESLYGYLEQIDKPVVRAMQHFRAEIADAATARHLAIKPGDPLLLVSRTGFTADDQPVEFTRTWCLNDYYDFVVELKK